MSAHQEFAAAAARAEATMDANHSGAIDFALILSAIVVVYFLYRCYKDGAYADMFYVAKVAGITAVIYYLGYVGLIALVWVFSYLVAQGDGAMPAFNLWMDAGWITQDEFVQILMGKYSSLLKALDWGLVGVCVSGAGIKIGNKFDEYREQRFEENTVALGPLVDGERHGQWELRYPDGRVQIGPYENGKMHGKWELQFADKSVETGAFENDKRHGQWEMRNPNGNIQSGPYVHGAKHGQWEERWSDGDVDTGQYVGDKKQGQWERRHPDNTVEIFNYVDDKVQE